ncbi:MAG: TonB-dependent receptor [Bacteroidota bacterium]
MKRVFISIILFFISYIAVAQHQVTGTVTDGEKGEPLVGVTVQVKGANRGTVTQSDGSFKLNVSSLDITLRFSFVGYQSREIPLRGRSDLDITLSKKIQEMDEVVVTSMRKPTLLENTPEPISVIDGDEIQAMNVKSTGEALQYLTGISVVSGTGSGLPKRSVLSMNGFPAGYNLVLVDGIRLLSDHIHSGQNVDLIPPENIAKIEYLKGASSSQYGSDAMGGIVNVITKKKSEQPQTSFFSSYGNYNTFSSGMSVRTPVNPSVNSSSFIKWEQSDGTPLLAPEHRIGNMGYEKLSLINSTNFELSDQSSFETSVYFIQNRTDWFGEKKYSRLFVPNIKFQSQLSQNLDITSGVNYSRWRAEVSNEKNDLFHPEMYLSWEGWKNNRLMAGWDYRYQEFKRSSVPGKSQQMFGMFLQDEYRLDMFSVFSALRFDKVENIKGVFSPKLAVLYNPVGFFKIRGSFGKGFSAPSLQDLYEKGAGHGGRAYRFGNENLKPEYSYSSTLNTELQINNDLEVSLYGYYSKIDNMITPVYDGPWEEDPTKYKWVRTNIYEAKIFGYEASTLWQFADWGRFKAGYTYTDNENTLTNEQLPYYPGRSLFGRLMYNLRISDNVLGKGFVSLKAVRDRSAWSWKPADDVAPDNMEGHITELKDYELLNAGMSFQFKNHYDLYINIQNILGQNIERLDDLYTVIQGEPVFKGGFKYHF